MSATRQLSPLIPVRRDARLLEDYLAVAPSALAFERYLECRIYQGQELLRPVLDLGCGDGIMARVFFREPIDTGVDPDPQEIARAGKLDAYVELLENFGDCIPKPDQSFATVLSNSVLEHIPQVEPVLAEIFRLLRPGGRFLFTVPSHRFDEFSIGHLFLRQAFGVECGNWFRQRYNQFWRHYHHYEVPKWVQLATDAGFVVEDAHYYDPPRICMLNDVLVPFGGFGMVNKKLFGKWVVWKKMRRVVARFIAALARGILEGGSWSRQGGLVFVAAFKPAN